METQKIYLAGNSGNGGTSDPNSLLWASIMNNGGFGGNNGLWWLFLLLFARNGYGGFGENGIQSQLNNDRANDWVLQAINGNRTAIENLASTLNCDVSAIQNTLCQIAAQIQNVAAKTELSGAQIINAIQAGNSQVMNMMATCCCDLKGIMSQGFASIGYEFKDQTCQVKEAIAASTAQILAGQQKAEMREMQDKIDALREDNQAYKYGSMLGAYIGPLKQDIDQIKCHLPKTVVIPANDDYVRIDRSISEPYSRSGCGFAYGAGYGAGYGFPFPNGGGFFG